MCMCMRTLRAGAAIVQDGGLYARKRETEREREGERDGTRVFVCNRERERKIKREK